MVEVDKTNFSQEVLTSSFPVLVSFTAKWCQPCKKMAPLISQLEQKYSQQIRFVSVDIEKSHDLAVSYMIMSIPAFIVFKDKQTSEIKSGIISKSDIEDLILEYI